MLSLIFLALYSLVCFFRIDRNKTIPWMVANLAFVAGMGVLSLLYQNVYLLLGVVATVGSVGYSLFGAKLPLMGNLKTYAKMVLSNLLFYPVGLFEDFYNKVKAKL